MLLPLAVAALLIAPAPAQGAGPDAFASAPVPAAAAEQVFIQLKIEVGGKTLKHPGHKMETGEELVLVLNEGKTKHEAVVYVESADEGYSVEVTYRAGGEQKLKGTKPAKRKAWVSFESDDEKAKVSVKVNPGNKRVDGVKIPDGNDPLDGL